MLVREQPHPRSLHSLQPSSDAMADTNVEEQLQAVLSQSKNDAPDLQATGDAFQAIANALRLQTAGMRQALVVFEPPNKSPHCQPPQETVSANLSYRKPSSRSGSRQYRIVASDQPGLVVPAYWSYYELQRISVMIMVFTGLGSPLLHTP